jgi:hypothetical protein
VAHQRKRIKPYLDALKELGFEIVEVAMTGKRHYRVDVTLGGNTQFTVLPNSPSDRRSFLNWLSDVKRMRREMDAG